MKWTLPPGWCTDHHKMNHAARMMYGSTWNGPCLQDDERIITKWTLFIAKNAIKKKHDNSTPGMSAGENLSSEKLFFGTVKIWVPRNLFLGLFTPTRWVGLEKIRDYGEKLLESVQKWVRVVKFSACDIVLKIWKWSRMRDLEILSKKQRNPKYLKKGKKR